MLGRFISADTIVPQPENPQAWNRYSYTVNNPLKYTDPSGHCFIFCFAAIGAAIGAVVNAVAYTVQVASTGQPWDAGAFVGAVATGAATGVLTAVSIIVEPIDYAMTAVQCVTAGCSAADVALTLVPGAIGPVARQIDNVLDVAKAAENAGDAVKAVENAQDTVKMVETASETVPRSGPKGVDPAHHNANVLVRDAAGNVTEHKRIVSGNMTPDEKALPFPQNTLASHTEARAVRQTTLSPGQSMTITGQHSPCPSCKGAMNRAARQSGATIRYRWRENGMTQYWNAANE